MTESPAGARQERIRALDGLRGIAIVLVVLSHGWTLWPTEKLTKIRPFDGLFWSGNLAVTLFFVVGGFVVSRGLLAQTEGGARLNPFRFYLRRFIRLGVHLYPLLLAVLAVSAWDNTDTYSAATTRESLLSIGTYNWNWYLMNHALTARPDLGHLWYLSVEQQFYVALGVVIALLSRYRRQVIASLVILVAAVAVWRAHVLHVEGWWPASLRTTTRMDGLLLGVLAAMTVDYLRRFRRYATTALWLSCLAMVTLVLVSSEKGELDFLRTQGLVFDVAAAVFVVAAYHAPAESGLLRALSQRPLCAVGTASLAIYLWHYPLFWAVSRHTHRWDWAPRTLVAFALLAVIVVVSQLLLDRPTKRWLGRHLQPPDRTATHQRHAPEAVA